MISTQTDSNSVLQNTLDDDIKCFAESLPEFGKYLSSKILAGEKIDQEQLKVAYELFKEEYGLKEKNHRELIQIECFREKHNAFKTDLLLTKVENVEGVNALVSNQVLEFNNSLTIIYGVNESGKSGYTRLFKKAFFSRDKEEISPNIFQEEAIRSVKADFSFSSDGHSYKLHFPQDTSRIEYLQFAVFDRKCALTYLDGKNEYEFKPSGLLFFSDLIDAYKRLEQMLLAEINENNQIKDFVIFFEGASDIKDSIGNLPSNTNLQSLKSVLPYTDKDKGNLEDLERRRALLLTQNTEKEITKLNELKAQFSKLETSINNANNFFCRDSISKIYSAIEDCKNKEVASKQEGLHSFRSVVNYNIDNAHWLEFIEAAERFASSQDRQYPKEIDSCLFCQQPLSVEATQLINKYWIYLKSEAENNYKIASEYLDKIKGAYVGAKLDILSESSICYQWLSENNKTLLNTITEQLNALITLKGYIVSDLENCTINYRKEIQIDSTTIKDIIINFDEKIQELSKADNKVELQEINRQITNLKHREKLQLLVPEIEKYVDRLKWASSAIRTRNKLATNKITLKEKELSRIYFHEDYISTFKKECNRLKGDFGISISHTGSLGSSFRQLNILSHNPSKILSEGEQKVISLADFLSEIKHSEINKGVIFDDPVTSLDENRKACIAERLVEESRNRQVIIFTHDLVFVSNLISKSNDLKISFDCHWIEKQGDKPGFIWLRNTPSYEKEYKTSKKAQDYYQEAKKSSPETREEKLKHGFAALRTSYEAMVVFDFFNGVVQRFVERVSVDSLSNVCLDSSIKDEIMDSFAQCCRYMEGHSHSDKYLYQKPTVEDLITEIQRFDSLKKKIKDSKKPSL